MTATWASGSRRVKLARFIGASVPLSLLVLALIYANYHTLQELKASSLRIYEAQTNDPVEDLQYFLDERLVELWSLGDSSALTAYHENKSAGMSLRYGLLASIATLQERLESSVERGRRKDVRPFVRLAVTDEDGAVLAEVPADASQQRPLPARLRLPQGDPLRAEVWDLGPSGHYLVLSVAVHRGDEVIGRVVGVISWNTAAAAFRDPALEAATVVVLARDAADGATLLQLPVFGQSLPPGNIPAAPGLVVAPLRQGDVRTEFVFNRLDLDRWPFAVVSAIPAAVLLGSEHPTMGYVFTAAMVLFLLGVGFYTLYLYANTLALGASVAEAERREQEVEATNARLRAEIAEREAAEERIRDSLREKEILLREIHHRVKNNLQVVLSLLNLQSGSLQNPADERLFTESKNRIRAIALVHEQLYRSPNLGRIDLDKYVAGLTRVVLASYGKGERVHARVAFETGIELSIDAVIPLGLILNELLTNACKHAFPDRREGHIAILGREEAGWARIEVADDGVGLPEDFDPATVDSLGMQIVDGLVSQLGGTIAFQGGREGRGTLVRLSFPVQAQERD